MRVEGHLLGNNIRNGVSCRAFGWHSTNGHMWYCTLTYTYVRTHMLCSEPTECKWARKSREARGLKKSV